MCGCVYPPEGGSVTLLPELDLEMSLDFTDMLPVVILYQECSSS